MKHVFVSGWARYKSTDTTSTGYTVDLRVLHPRKAEMRWYTIEPNGWVEVMQDIPRFDVEYHYALVPSTCHVPIRHKKPPMERWTSLAFYKKWLNRR